MTKYQFINIITHPLAISLLFTIIVIQFIPPIFDKYSVTQTLQERTPNGSTTYYYDLNNNGYSEKIELHLLAINNLVGVIVSTKKGTINQWNFNGEILNQSSLFFGDINNDGVDEIFISTLHNKTIYLSCFNPFENKYYFKEKAISDYFRRNNKISCTISKCELYDLNGDFINEVYFSITANYSKYPRRMYAYDSVNDTLYESPLGFATFERPFAFDIDGDTIPEFFGSPQAVGNCELDDPYSDNYLWLMLLDEKMSFQFQPKKIGYFPSFTSVIPFQSNNKSFLTVLINYSGNKDINGSLALYNSDGKKIKEKKKIFNENVNWYNPQLFSNNSNYENLFLITGEGIIEEYNENLEVIKSYNIPQNGFGIPKEFDLDSDGENELIFNDKWGEHIIITRNNFSDPVIVNISDTSGPYNLSLIKNGKEGNSLFVEGEKYRFTFNYKSNILYYLKYIIYSGIFLGFFLIALIAQKTQKHQVERKHKTEKKIAELQMKSIKNQIDPHFTLNILNSIGSLFAKQEIEKANYIFGKYSKLLRTTILGSDNILTTLQSEIEYVENYLAIEKFRMQDRFNYKIEIDNAVNLQTKIPKTLMHTFAENAIKHGLRHLEKDGELTISIKYNNSNYYITIHDNGIGRKKAKEITAFSTGKGLSILNQMLELYLNLEKIKIKYKFTDLVDIENNPLGTEIIIIIPNCKV